MEQRTLGKSGIKVSVVGLGCNNFGAKLNLEASRPVIHAAIDAGITLFDTADSYGNRGGSETVLGQVLGPRRKDLVLATKFGRQMDDEGRKKGASRAYIAEAVHASLRRLQTDWIDLYQLHYPDPDTPIDETLRAIEDLIAAGKVRCFGVSNMPADEIGRACATAAQLQIHGPVTCQDEYSLLRRGAEELLIPAMREQGLSLLPYFPLANGLLSGKYRPGVAPAPETRLGAAPYYVKPYLNNEDMERADRLRRFAEAKGYTLLELAFSWLATQPVVASVIAGATTVEQVRANSKAAILKLGADELEAIDVLTKD